MSTANFTDSEIDAMTASELRTALGSIGKTTTGVKAVLRTRLKAAQQPQQPTGGSQSQGAATAAATARKNTQEWKDLMIVLKACSLSDDQAEKFADVQELTDIIDLMLLAADETEATVLMYNKGLDTTEAHLRITAAISKNRLQALTHRVHVWQLAGVQLGAAEWSSVLQANQGVMEYRAFVQREKNKSEPTEFPAELKPEMFGTDGERTFTTIHTTLGLCSSAHGGGASLNYLVRDPNSSLGSNPTMAERMEHGLPHSGEIYDADNARLFNFLEKLCISHAVWQGIRKHQATKDGRKAYMHLKSSYQGHDHILSRLKAEKKKISEGNEGLRYAGEHKDRWVEYASNLAGAFDFIGRHREQYSDESRVERLLQGFTGETLQKPNLEYAINHVKDSPQYRTDYGAAVAYLATKIQEAYGNTTSTTTTRTVSEAIQEQRDGDATDDRGYYERGGYRGRGGGYRGRGGGHFHQGGGRGNFLGQGTFVPSELRSKYDGKTHYPEINGIKTDDSVVRGTFSNEAFSDPVVRFYVKKRREHLKQNNAGHGGGGGGGHGMTPEQVKALAKDIAQAQSGKRPGNDTNEPRDNKKQKGGEQNGWNFMGKDAER